MVDVWLFVKGNGGGSASDRPSFLIGLPSHLMASTRQIGVAIWSSDSATAGLARVVLAGVGLVVVGDRRRVGARPPTRKAMWVSGA